MRYLQRENQKKVLIVEDDYLQSFFLKFLLENQNFRVVGVTDTGEEAIEIAEKFSPDLVLMDILLNGNMDGIEAAKRIQMKSDISLIYITGLSDSNYRIRAEQTNYIEYLIKPVSSDILLHTLSKYFPVQTSSQVRKVKVMQSKVEFSRTCNPAIVSKA